MRRALPFVSLVVGVGGGFFMNRSPGRAWLIVVASVLGWLFLSAVAVAERIIAARRLSSLQARGARFLLALGAQVASQQALVFPIPFFWNAGSSSVVSHWVFALVYALALTAVLWDPLYARALEHRAPAASLHGFSAFVGLMVVLPMLGASHGLAVGGAAAGAALGAIVQMALAGQGVAWRRLLIAVVGAGAVAMLLVLLVRFIPPAPLQLTRVTIGPRIVNKEIEGAAPRLPPTPELYCATAIRAPLGVKQQITHVWLQNGRKIADIPVDVAGGARDAGYRTWSKKSGHPKFKAGKVTCRVETASGQVLGQTSVRIVDGG